MFSFIPYSITDHAVVTKRYSSLRYPKQIDTQSLGLNHLTSLPLKPLSDPSITLSVAHDTELHVPRRLRDLLLNIHHPHTTRLQVRDNTTSQTIQHPLPRDQPAPALDSLEAEFAPSTTTHGTTQMSRLRITEPLDLTLLHRAEKRRFNEQLHKSLHDARVPLRTPPRSTRRILPVRLDGLDQMARQRTVRRHNTVSTPAFDAVEQPVQSAHVRHRPGVRVGQDAVAGAQLGAKGDRDGLLCRARCWRGSGRWALLAGDGGPEGGRQAGEDAFVFLLGCGGALADER